MNASLSQIPQARNWGCSFGKFYAIGAIPICFLNVIIIGLSALAMWHQQQWLAAALGTGFGILSFIWVPISVVSIAVFERMRVSTRAPLLFLLSFACYFQFLLFYSFTAVALFANICMVFPMLLSLVVCLWFYPRENWRLFTELKKRNGYKIDDVTESAVLKSSFASFKKRLAATVIDAVILGTIGAIVLVGLGIYLGLSQHLTPAATHSELIRPGYVKEVTTWGLEAAAIGFALSLITGIVGSTFIPNSIAFVLGFSLPEYYNSPSHPTGGWGAAYLYGLACFAWLYYAFMESSPLQGTIGKRTMGIVVANVKGERISFWKATARYFSKTASVASIYTGFLLALFSLKKQTLHDYLAGCVVLNKVQKHIHPIVPIIGLTQTPKSNFLTPATKMADGAFKLRQVIRKQVCLICNREFDLADDMKMCPDDGSMLSPVFEDPFIGTIIDDKYEILERIASGGTSKIYKARHLILERHIALKVLQGGQEITEAQLGRFQREAQAAIGLVHPNIVRVFDYGTHPQPYIVMEYVEGKTLSTLLEEEGALPAKCALPYFTQVSEAMHVAHVAGLVHRDLKPSNIIIEEQSGTAKVLDFGLVKDFVDDAKYTRTGETVGSPAYMSPEQCKGLPLDGRSDIYSLGCVMYEILTGKCPFAGDNTVECMFKHLEMPVPPLRKTRRDLTFPTGLDRVINNCLAKDPQHRYQSMAELRQDLAIANSGSGKRIKVHDQTSKSRLPIKPLPLVGLSILIVAGITVSYQEMTRPHWDKLLHEGETLVLNGHTTADTARSVMLLHQAKLEAEEAHAPDNKLEDIYVYLGESYEHLNHPQGAKHLFQHALDLNLKHAEDVPRSHCHAKLSDVYWELGDGNEALKHARLSLEIASRLSRNQTRLCSDWYVVGHALLKLNRAREAIDFLAKARQIGVRTKGENYDFLTTIDEQLGTAYFNEGRDQESFDAYGRSLALSYELHQDYWGDLDTFVECLSKRGGIKALSETALRHKLCQDLWSVAKVKLLVKQHKFDEAALSAIEYDKSRGSETTSVAYSWKGACYESAGRFEEAVENFRRDIQLNPDQPAVNYGRFARCLLNLCKYNDALVELNKAVKSHPDNYEFYYYRGLVFFHIGEFRHAAEDFLQFLKLENWYYSLECEDAAILASLAYRFEHDETSAQKVLSKFEEKTYTREYPDSTIAYLCGNITPEQLVIQHSNDKWQVTEAHALIGLNLLTAGKRGEAIKYLTWVLDHGRADTPFYTLSTRFLRRDFKVPTKANPL